ncbi:hypothetical protein [Halococcus thailandensis]|uniref:DUF7988 domain-containing protein n=1 Tax=Halococcus thailandensis JCM 13552 TaxID=1227457 RepID=M0N2P1_9EURY|nr:hypothetical protein [Halococcus thailandensis]EMA51793.1 hypothetical protein C451_13606 [Halococcus thailandensis JCM 13552]
MNRKQIVHEAVLDDHESLLETILDCADGVAASWDDEGTAERQRVVEPFESALADRDVTDRLPTLLADAVAALGEELPAEPVAAPPYLTITSVGPVLRATLADTRLVMTIRVFVIERDPTRYVRGATTPSEALEVALKSH